MADWVHDSIYEFTPYLRRNEAEFYFVANDPTDELLVHLQQKGYRHYVNRNEVLTQEQLFEMGYGKPEYLHRVYRGWNKAILQAKGEIVVLVNSDNYFSPDWLENMLKCFSQDSIITSKLVEREHPEYGVIGGAHRGEFGRHPDDFDRQGFLDFCDKKRITGMERGGAYMPCMFSKDTAVKVGLYPEGNIAGKSFDDVVSYGDRVFFENLARMGVEHFTALDSLVYHLKEGEMADTPDSADQQICADATSVKDPSEGDHVLRRRSSESMSDTARSFNKEGEEFFNAGNMDDAEAAFLRCLEFSPDCADAHNNLGVVYSLQPNHQLALKYFTKAVSLEPENRLFVTNYGRLRESLGRVSQAKNVYCVDRLRQE
jgi:hypothetical protein